MSSPAATLPRPSRSRSRARALTARIPADGWWTLALGALLSAVALEGGGGLQLGRVTTVSIGLVLLSGAAGTVAVLTTPRERLHGGPALAAFVLLAAVTMLSILWAVQPADAWQEANRTLSYLAVFAAGIALVRIAPQRWSGVIGATILAALVVSLYALATKVFPGALAPDEQYARLREPFAYWNAVGLMAALGAPGCLWLGARRTGHPALNAVAWPVLGLLLVAILLAYSRGSLLALVVGCGAWFVLVPLRLRGVAVLACSATAAGLVSLWAFGQEGLSEDRLGLTVRTSAGHELGIALVAMVLALTVAGLAICFAASRRAPGEQARRRAGTAILVALALVPVGAAGALALSEQGLGGSLSDGWSQLTDVDSATSNDPSRLTAVSSVRAKYFDESLKIWKARPVVGAGAGGYAIARLRVRRDAVEVRHAHSYVFQTAADLGLLGLVASGLLCVAFLWAAAKACAIRSARRVDAEVAGLRTLLAVVVVFGVHSLVDWTWFIPGTAVLAILCAGWLAGRGPGELAPATGLRERLRTGVRGPLALAAAGVVVLTVATAWTTFQPERAVLTGNDALDLLDRGEIEPALAKTEDARRIDPLSVEPLFERAVVDVTARRRDAARTALEDAVRLQPQNPVTWLRLAQFELEQDPARAIQVLGPALYLDPKSPTGASLFLEATRRLTAPN